MKKNSRFSVFRAQRGYSLIEALVVVAIIGIFSLIAIPNFVGMYRSNKLKTSLRDVTSDMRWARQRAASRDRFAAFSIIGDSQFAVYEGTLDPTDPKKIIFADDPVRGPKDLDPSVKFTSTGDFADKFTKGGGIDIVFAGDGTVWNMPTNIDNAYVVVKTDYDIPKNTYKIALSNAGRVSATSN